MPKDPNSNSLIFNNKLQEPRMYCNAMYIHAIFETEYKTFIKPGNQQHNGI